MLDDQALAAALADLPDWTAEDRALVRAFRRRDWRDAIAFVNAVAEEADRRDHHPDISSHDAGGVTKRDVNLARRIDELAAGTDAG